MPNLPALLAAPAISKSPTKRQHPGYVHCLLIKTIANF
ncbi:hypothetical protein BMETH_69_6 [methanotrophic bacterial endosymbiont of Bathymodiolus sp.]|nr:hypothetical protein BMETH_69_6 [methanotrophic bacterial endosymbiont of Bathymodiolus sp.]